MKTLRTAHLMLAIVFMYLVSLSASAVMCKPQQRGSFGTKADAKILYDQSGIIAIFEVVAIEKGNFYSNLLLPAGRYQKVLTLRPKEVIKGKIGKMHIHKYVAINNNLPFPFQVHKQYLMAIKGSGDVTENGTCEWPFSLEASEANFKFYVDAFKDLAAQNGGKDD